MNSTHTAKQTDPSGLARAAYEAPRFRVISLDCEISAYAPDDGDDQPLF